MNTVLIVLAAVLVVNAGIVAGLVVKYRREDRDDDDNTAERIVEVGESARAGRLVLVK